VVLRGPKVGEPETAGNLYSLVEKEGFYDWRND
jgi:hypothetical protein